MISSVNYNEQEGQIQQGLPFDAWFDLVLIFAIIVVL